jgi:hypothetical protein
MFLFEKLMIGTYGDQIKEDEVGSKWEGWET